MADLGTALLDLHVGIGIRPTLIVENQSVTTNKALCVLGARLDTNESPVSGATTALGDRLGDDRRGGVRSDVNHLGPRVLVLAFAGESYRKHLAVSARLHQPNRRVLHREAGSEVAVHPFHSGIPIGGGTLGDQVEHIVRPVLNRGVPAAATLFHDDLDHGAVKRIGGIGRGRAPLDVVNEGPLVDDDQGPLELAHVLRVDPEVSLKRLVDVDPRRHIDKGTA